MQIQKLKLLRIAMVAGLLNITRCMNRQNVPPPIMFSATDVSPTGSPRTLSNNPTRGAIPRAVSVSSQASSDRTSMESEKHCRPTNRNAGASKRVTRDAATTPRTDSVATQTSPLDHSIDTDSTPAADKVAPAADKVGRNAWVAVNQDITLDRLRRNPKVRALDGRIYEYYRHDPAGNIYVKSPGGGTYRYQNDNKIDQEEAARAWEESGFMIKVAAVTFTAIRLAVYVLLESHRKAGERRRREEMG